ncbi:MarR family winged helix-turn-helix transcriptional regulator [Streptomyces sp. NPDC006872]|uniref:MarR family winged helix-turn-helix transcriptional regulator n=1 Tax=Streptomyces sp. NPDC006872 TaxID=3155720 RepID=UPI0033FB023A
MTRPSQLKPIGFYLKHLDTLINREFEQSLADRSLTRRHWQVLHDLAATGPHDAATLTERLRPFWGEGAITLDEITSGLRARGWITHDVNAGTYTATPEGGEAHTEIEELVKATRTRLTTGVTGEEYVGTVTVLARMCRNLERGD